MLFTFAVKNPRPAIDIRNRPRIPVPDEDPYSIAGSGSSGSSGNGNRERSRDKPPKLPPRDNSIYATGGGLGKMKVKYQSRPNQNVGKRRKKNYLTLLAKQKLLFKKIAFLFILRLESVLASLVLFEFLQKKNLRNSGKMTHMQKNAK